MVFLLFPTFEALQRNESTEMMKTSYFSLPAAILLSVIVLIVLATQGFSQALTSHSLGNDAISLESLRFSDAKEKLFTSIPFTQNSQDSLIIVSVQVNGHDPMPFLVDTGSNQPVIIAKWAADQLKLAPAQKSTKFSPDSHPFPATTLQSLVVKAKRNDKDIEYDSFSAYISDAELPSSSSSHIAGILGLPLFYQLVVQLDFSRHVINLSEQLDRSQLESDAVILPLNQPDPTDVRFLAACPLSSSAAATHSKNDIGNDRHSSQTTIVKVDLLLDTGANSSSLSEAIIPVVHPAAMSVGPLLSIKGWMQESIAFVPKFSIGSFVISDLCVRCPSCQKNGFSENVIGMDILEHFRVTLDFPHKQMILDKFDNKASCNAPTTTGVFLEKQGNAFYVARVSPRSPAAKELIRVGDKVTQIGGVDLDAYSIEAAQGMLDGNAGTGVRLLLVSVNGISRKVTLSRLTLYNASLYPGYGFFVAKRSPDEAILSRYILCSSPAWKAGIRAGDVITAINNILVTTTDQARSLLNAWPEKTLTLTIQRDGKPQTIMIK